MEKLRFSLLRWGIISSYYRKKTDEKGVFFLEINDPESLQAFIIHIGFGAERKQRKLVSIRKRANRTRQLSLSGREVLRLARSVGLNTMDFPNTNMFFADKRKMSLEVFERQILPAFKKAADAGSKEACMIVQILRQVLLQEAVFPKILRIDKITGESNFFDLSIEGTENFVTNGIVVHNSALRYDRTVEAAKDSYYSRVGSAMDDTLFASGISRVIIGGPGPIKEIFIKKKPYNYQFKILGVSDIGYVDDYGISQLAAKSVDIINEEKTVRQRQMLEKFLKEIVKDGLATYGVREVLEALKLGKVEVLLLSEDFALKRATGKCPQGHEQEVFAETGKEYKCKVCGEKLTVSEGTDLFDELCDLAEEKGIKLEIISADTSDGAQFLAGFKGIGALIRYR